MNLSSRTYKVCLIGAPASGKTIFLDRMLTGEYNKNYTPTLGVEVNPLSFHTNYGLVTLNIWDTAGQERFGGLRDGYFIAGDAAMVFSDLTSPATLVESKRWTADFARVCPGKPVVQVANKVDVTDHESFPVLDREMILCSARSNYNMEQVWPTMVRTVTGLADLVFREALAITPPEVSLTLEDKEWEQWDDQWEEAEQEKEEQTVQQTNAPMVIPDTLGAITAHAQMMAGFVMSKL